MAMVAVRMAAAKSLFFIGAARRIPSVRKGMLLRAACQYEMEGKVKTRTLKNPICGRVHLASETDNHFVAESRTFHESTWRVEHPQRAEALLLGAASLWVWFIKEYGL
jgi:hypothetical protein